jgi:hypothetical protein
MWASCWVCFVELYRVSANLVRFAIGIVGDAGVRGTAQQPRLYVGMILILIFAEVLGKISCLCFRVQETDAVGRPVWVDCGSFDEL